MTGDVIDIEMRGRSTQLQGEIDQANKRAKELKKTISEIEKDGGKGSENWQKYKNELKATQDQAAKLSKELKTMDVSSMTMRQLQQHAKDLAKEMNNADRSSQDYVKNAKRLGEVEKELAKAQKQAAALKTEGQNLGNSGLWSKITGGVKGVGTAFQAIMALQVIQWIIGIGKEIFTTTATFEKYEKVLTTALGSQKLAKQSLEAIKDMAKQTTFGVDELTDGYVKMVNRGLRPSQKEMMAMADLAASQGKTFDQLVEAVLDAQTGEFERLKEFGVKARKEGDNVSLSFKGQTQVVKNNEEAIYQAMIAMGSMTGVTGQNAQIMETLGGKASNFGDVMDSLKVAIGDRLSPIFKYFLDALSSGIEWFVKIIQASDPVLAVFEDLFTVVGEMAGAFFNIFSNIFPKFNAGGNALTTVMQGIGWVFRSTLAPTQLLIGVLGDVFEAMAGIVQGGKAVVQVLAGDFTGAAKSFENAKSNFSNVGTHATASFDKIKKGWTEAFVTQPEKDKTPAILAAKTTEQGRQDEITKEQQKALDKREKERSKSEKKINELIAQLDAEHNQVTADKAIETEEFKINEKRRRRLKEVNDSVADEKTKLTAIAAVNRNADAEIFALREKDNKKALELIKQLEAEHVQKTTRDAVDAETSKIEEIRRKRLAEVKQSAADETVKTELINAINKNAEDQLAKIQEEYRQKRIKKEQEAAQKRLETENFIRDQEHKAEMSIFDWREMQARGNAKKLAAIQKERIDVELRLTQDKIQQELEADQRKALALTTDAEQLSKALEAIENRYHAESLIAEKEAAAKKVDIDKAAHEKKVDILRQFADLFKGSLSDNLYNLIGATIEMVAVSKKGDKDQVESAQEKYEKMAAAAQAAVNFLNGLAQARAQKAIDEAKRELAERTAILQQEIAITEAMMQASTDFVTQLKESESGRINALQTALTAENETELNKRAAASKFYSDQLQMLKESEEAKITEMQTMANLAKTEDEKQAIEAKIILAKQEAAEKIALAEQQMNQSIADNQKLVELQQTLTSETTTEEQKRSAVKESYSILLQNLMQQQEAHITDLQMQANQAKTADERAAIEEKIRLAELEKDRKIALMEQERDQKTATLQELDEVTKQLTEKQLADAAAASEKQIQMASDEAEQKADFKADLEETIAAENRKARATEVAEKKKAFAAQKKADIATALITGALAVLKALANFFPLNIILAATAAVVTGVQIAKIKNQPDPSFAKGGTLGQVVKGGKHGSEYGAGGIALIDRATGRDVGEMEGEEAIISAGQTSANWPLIQQMFKNARTPGKTHSAVTAHPGVPMAFKDGGKFESPYFERGMYLFGSKKRKAEQAAKDAEAEAAKAQAEADAAMGDMPSFDAGAYGGIDDGGGVSGDTASASAAHEAAQKMGQDQLQAILDILDETVANGQALDRVVTTVADLKGSVNGVESAVNSVRDAVYGTNTQGKFDQLIGAISSMNA